MLNHQFMVLVCACTHYNIVENLWPQWELLKRCIYLYFFARLSRILGKYPLNPGIVLFPFHAPPSAHTGNVALSCWKELLCSCLDWRIKLGLVFPSPTAV